MPKALCPTTSPTTSHLRHRRIRESLCNPPSRTSDSPKMTCRTMPKRLLSNGTIPHFSVSFVAMRAKDILYKRRFCRATTTVMFLIVRNVTRMSPLPIASLTCREREFCFNCEKPDITGKDYRDPSLSIIVFRPQRNNTFQWPDRMKWRTVSLDISAQKSSWKTFSPQMKINPKSRTASYRLQQWSMPRRDLTR
jgi:hypothetical protein